jgi:peptidoglycan hydrolase CwlO-like protein
MYKILKDYSGSYNAKTPMNADGSIPVPPTMDEINSLQLQLTNANKQLSSLQGQIAQAQQDRNNCKKRSGLLFPTWDNSCLDANNSLQASLNSQISSTQNNINDLVKNKIPDAQKRYNDLNAAYQAAIKAKGQADPAVIAAQIQSQASQAGLRNKLVLIAGIVIAVIVLSAGIFLYLEHRKG